MTLYQVEIEQRLKRRFLIECDDEEDAREAAESGLGADLEPYDFDDDDIEVYRLPPNADPSGVPRWVGGDQGRWA